jgi:hypothetical protein
MKKIIAAVVLAVLMTGFVCAQSDEAKPAMNAITVDLGPTLLSSVMGGVLNSMVGGASGFGIGAQYERHIFRMLSAAARFDYLGMGLSFSGASIDLKSWSIEGHARFYPFSGAFFLDALLGYANYSAALSGGGENRNSGGDFFKAGGKVGWKIDFGKPGGFIFEPSFGYSAGIGSLTDFGKISTGYKEADDKLKDVVGSINEMNALLANYVFVGGPKVGLAFGWAF